VAIQGVKSSVLSQTETRDESLVFAESADVVFVGLGAKIGCSWAVQGLRQDLEVKLLVTLWAVD
jgi:hypothetical protein